MQSRSWLYRSLLLLAIATPTLFSTKALHAQFQPVSQEELKMTSDPKAPGAAAVYLDIEDVADDMFHSRIFYARIKVLGEKGKELAKVEIPFQGKQAIDKDFATMQLPYQSTTMTLGQPTLLTGDKVVVSDFKARTIHPDGTIVPLEGKLENLLHRETTPQHTQRTVVTLPSVEVGSVLEYRFVERYDGLYSSPLWAVQRDYFVRKAHFSFMPYKSFLSGLENSTGSYLIDRNGIPLNFLLYYPVLPQHAELKRDAAQHFLLDVTDVPAAPHDEWMPPKNNLLYRVRFYYRSDSDAKGFWTKEAKFWSRRVDRLADPTRSIHDAVATLTAPGDSELEKAHKLYQAVQALDNTDFDRNAADPNRIAGGQAEKRAEETWTQKRGSSQDMALLYLAMLRAAGITAYDMKVVNRDKSVFAQDYLNFDQLDDDIVLAKINGKDVALDPGQKMCPFATLHWKHAGVGGMRETGSGSGVIATSPVQLYTANTLLRMGDINVDDHGVATGSFRFTMTGEEALHWRQEALLSDESELKKQFNLWITATAPPGVQAQLDAFEGLTDPSVNLVALVAVKGSPTGTSGQAIQLPCFPFEFRADHPFVDQAQRSTPIDMRYGDQVTDQVTYHLPAGVNVQDIPQDASIPWEGHAMFTVKSKSEAGQITLARSLSRAFTLAKPQEYGRLRDFYEKVASADRQEVNLARTSASLGN